MCELKLLEINKRGVEKGVLSDLVYEYSMSNHWYEMRRKTGMEMFTRTHQWRIVNELLSRNESEPLAQILLLAESLETDNYAHNLVYLTLLEKR